MLKNSQLSPSEPNFCCTAAVDPAHYYLYGVRVLSQQLIAIPGNLLLVIYSILFLPSSMNPMLAELIFRALLSLVLAAATKGPMIGSL